MKKYILSTFVFAAVLSFSCNNSNDSTNKTADSVVSGNTDSAGSQPVPGVANEGNATDTIVPLRTDSVIKH